MTTPIEAPEQPAETGTVDQSALIKALGGVDTEDGKDEPWIEPEDCEHCGCPSGDFEDADWKCGAWHCPECGQPQ